MKRYENAENFATRRSIDQQHLGRRQMLSREENEIHRKHANDFHPKTDDAVRCTNLKSLRTSNLCYLITRVFRYQIEETTASSK